MAAVATPIAPAPRRLVQPRMMGDDRQLADGLRRRDADTIARLHAEYGRTVLGFLARTLRNRSTAEDVFQQVFLEAWERGPSFDPARGSVLTWLMTIARSRAIDQLRRRVPEPRDPAGSLAMLEDDAVGARGPRGRLDLHQVDGPRPLVGVEMDECEAGGLLPHAERAAGAD